MNRVDQSQGLKSARTDIRQTDTTSRVGDIMKASVLRTAALKKCSSCFGREGGRGSPPNIFPRESYFIGYLRPHAKFHNPSTIRTFGIILGHQPCIFSQNQMKKLLILKREILSKQDSFDIHIYIFFIAFMLTLLAMKQTYREIYYLS